MKRAASWLVSAVVALSALGATAAPTYAYIADSWSNANAFMSACVGFNSTYPSQMNSQARAQLALLGYSPIGGALGAGFTRTAFLNNVFSEYGTYVHSHGDNYWSSSASGGIDSGFLQDPGSGRCNSSSDIIRASAIKSATMGTPYNLVVMSTCYLGSSNSTMPGAFQIEKTKSSTQREFYLGYVHSTYDSSAMRFEKAFFSYLNGGTNHNRTVYQAFQYAAGIGGYAAPDSADPFEANWWGNPNYNGTAG